MTCEAFGSMHGPGLSTVTNTTIPSQPTLLAISAMLQWLVNEIQYQIVPAQLASKPEGTYR